MGQWTKQITGGATSSPASTIQDFYRGSKNGKQLVWVGDSTTDPSTANLYTHLTNFYMQTGQLLSGATYSTKGLSGSLLKDFIANTTTNKLSDAIALKGDLYIISYGINDMIQNRTDAQIQADLKTCIDSILSQTNGCILLRIPNTFQNTNGTWLTSSAQAQEYSHRLWEIYQTFRNYNSKVDVIDIPSLIFGRQTFDTSPLMTNQLHPNDNGYWAIVDEIAERICGIDQVNYNLYQNYDVIMRGWVVHTTDVSNTSFTFTTTNPRTLQVGDVVVLGNSYSVVIPNTPTVTTNTGSSFNMYTWAFTHAHTGSFNNFGTVKVLRKKS